MDKPMVESMHHSREMFFNKRGILLIGILFLIGIAIGLVLSAFFVIETNDIIARINENPWGHPPGDPIEYHAEPLTPEQIILPTFGVIIVCISIMLLLGTIVVYLKTLRKTKSPYIAGLLFFLVPFLIQSLFSLRALRSLFLSPVIPLPRIRESIGFGFSGFGGILVILSVFEIIGLSILLYLSTE